MMPSLRQYAAQDGWTPTKYVVLRGEVVANPNSVFAGSLISATLTGRSLQRALLQHCHGDLVDVGCGTAPMRAIYEPLTRHYTCVDWPLGPHDTSSVHVFSDVASALPFRAGSFDTALSSDVLEHLEAPDVVAAEIARVLRLDGRLILTIPFLYPVHEAPHDFQRFTSHGLHRLCERAGLEVVELSPIGGSLDVLADLTSKHVAVVPVVGRLLARVLTRATLWFGETAVGQRVRSRTGATATLGYLLVASPRATPAPTRTAP